MAQGTHGHISRTLVTWPQTWSLFLIEYHSSDVAHYASREERKQVFRLQDSAQRRMKPNG